ncbi:helix-turn-helix domain-containing protein [Thalassotalea ponticola]|uniref:helix-turn-helix domain-containing protein n=1 Tax=Thalassotalea ponticola TaxID=1523392 RepID=UPI0025B5F3C4|nr:helix-turn-helix domain-containing protein [Thalassotalea ponticola]MDN3652602.1 helix-turn-helix domain-containing protein [Thalassotalea ponticola]
MDSLSVVNLIQSGTITVSILGFLLLWRIEQFKGIALLLCLIALACLINIVEETGITRDWYLISPLFIMLFGPATYLAAKIAFNRHLTKRDYWHLLPVLLALPFTSYVHIIIAVGTAWRVIYAFITATMLVKYKLYIDEQRSDADEYSLNWLVWLLVITTLFNLVDLARLNLQPVLPYELNVFGQGVNNLVWLIASMVLIYKFSRFQGLPTPSERDAKQGNEESSNDTEYQSLFTELNQLIVDNQWYLTPRLTLAQISELTGIQTRDISRAINLHTKKSFNEYINQFRVNTVCEKLRVNGGASLTDIAFDAGFSSKASFNKVFKQLTGKTPSEYKLSLGS